jgi:probable HAF family extracellular repeat protein
MKSASLLTAATSAALLIMGHSAQAAWNFVTLQDPAGVDTVASGINDSGQIVGNYTDSGAVTHGFGYSAGSYTTIDVPAEAATTASGISNSGQITGSYTDGTGGVHGFTQTGFAGTATSFDVPSGVGNTNGSGINSSAQTVGYYYDGTSTHGFSKVGASYTPLDVPGALTTQALGINNAGTVVGSFYDGTLTHGFVLTASIYTQMDDPLGAEGTVTTGVASDGDTVGYYTDGGGVTHGFVDQNGTFFSVDDPNAGSAPGQGTEILGIAPNGVTIVGQFTASNWTVGGFSAEIPEPATIALFGLGALGAVRLRRRRASAA